MIKNSTSLKFDLFSPTCSTNSVKHEYLCKMSIAIKNQLSRMPIFIFLQVKPLFEQAEAKNKLLRSVAGGGVDSLNHLLARWDKFELMMESHQLMVKEQV